MRIEWHCRDCDEKGKSDVDLLKVMEGRRNVENLMELVILFVKRTIHSGCKDNIGIKAQE